MTFDNLAQWRAYQERVHGIRWRYHVVTMRRLHEAQESRNMKRFYNLFNGSMVDMVEAAHRHAIRVFVRP